MNALTHNLQSQVADTSRDHLCLQQVGRLYLSRITRQQTALLSPQGISLRPLQGVLHSLHVQRTPSPAST